MIFFFFGFPLFIFRIGCKAHICPAQNHDNQRWATSNDYKLYFHLAKCTCINGPNGHTHGNPHGSRFIFMTKKLPTSCFYNLEQVISTLFFSYFYSHGWTRGWEFWTSLINPFIFFHFSFSQINLSHLFLHSCHLMTLITGSSLSSEEGFLFFMLSLSSSLVIWRPSL